MTSGSEARNVTAGGGEVDKPAYLLHRGDPLAAFGSWPAPAVMINDGAYGVRGFHGDTTGSDGLPDGTGRHVEAWGRYATPATTLWFWTRMGWATVHPLLAENGWEYVQLITWDKGSRSHRGQLSMEDNPPFPVETEMCVFYQRRFEVPALTGLMPVQQWLRRVARAGLPLTRATMRAASVTPLPESTSPQDWLWYWPPGEMIERLAVLCQRARRSDPVGLTIRLMEILRSPPKSGMNSVPVREGAGYRVAGAAARR